MGTEIKLIDAIKTQKLRHLVLWPHLASFEDCVIDPDKLDSTFHVGAVNGNQVLGTSTFLSEANENFEENSQYRLRAMATHPAYRGTGLGEEIVASGIKELKERGIKVLWCDARIIATGFYKRIGFSVKGEVYDVPKIGPHKLMFLEL